MLQKIKKTYQLIKIFSAKKTTLLYAFSAGVIITTLTNVIDKLIYSETLITLHNTALILLSDFNHDRAIFALLLLLAFILFDRLLQKNLATEKIRQVVKFLVFSPLTITSLSLLFVSGLLLTASVIESDNFARYLSASLMAALLGGGLRFIMSYTPTLKRGVAKITDNL